MTLISKGMQDSLFRIFLQTTPCPLDQRKKLSLRTIEARFVRREDIVAKASKDDRVNVRIRAQRGVSFTTCDLDSFLDRETVDAAAYGGQRQTLEFELRCQGKAGLV